jgi:hypothetical protein
MMGGSTAQRMVGLPVVCGVGKRPLELKTGDQNDVGRRAIDADEKKDKRTAMMGDDERE